MKFIGYLISRLLFQRTSRYRAKTRTPLCERTRTHMRARTIRHACTHREAYGRCIVIRRNDCTSWCTSLCNRCASLSAITCVSTTVKARMCTGCNSIYLHSARNIHTIRYINDVSFRGIFLSFSRAAPETVGIFITKIAKSPSCNHEIAVWHNSPRVIIFAYPLLFAN